MESQHENPEFRNAPESFHPCKSTLYMQNTIFLNQGILKDFGLFTCTIDDI